MHQIIPGRLWISSSYEARDVRRVLDLGIEAIVDLAMQEPPLAVTRELIYLRIPVLDGDGNDVRRLSMAIKSLVELIRRQVPCAGDVQCRHEPLAGDRGRSSLDREGLLAGRSSSGVGRPDPS